METVYSTKIENGNWKMEIGNAKWQVPCPIGARARAREPIDHGITMTDRCQG